MLFATSVYAQERKIDPVLPEPDINIISISPALEGAVHWAFNKSKKKWEHYSHRADFYHDEGQNFAFMHVVKFTADGALYYALVYPHEQYRVASGAGYNKYTGVFDGESSNYHYLRSFVVTEEQYKLLKKSLLKKNRKTIKIRSKLWDRTIISTYFRSYMGYRDKKTEKLTIRVRKMDGINLIEKEYDWMEDLDRLLKWSLKKDYEKTFMLNSQTVNGEDVVRFRTPLQPGLWGYVEKGLSKAYFEVPFDNFFDMLID